MKKEIISSAHTHTSKPPIINNSNRYYRPSTAHSASQSSGVSSFTRSRKAASVQNSGWPGRCFPGSAHNGNKGSLAPLRLVERFDGRLAHGDRGEVSITLQMSRQCQSLRKCHSSLHRACQLLSDDIRSRLNFCPPLTCSMLPHVVTQLALQTPYS